MGTGQRIDLNSWNSNVDIVDQLRYFKEQNELKRIELEEKRKEKEARDNGKLGLNSINEYLFIREERTVGIAYYPDKIKENREENQEEIVQYFTFTEMSLYEIFQYLIIKKQNDIDLLLSHTCGPDYDKIIDVLPIEQKIDLLNEIEDLNNINEMFKGEDEDSEDDESKKKKKKDKEKVTTLADCIRIFGGTIIYLCEEWGKLPVDIMQNLTYRQFKWYMDIIVERQEKLEERLEEEKNNNGHDNRNNINNKFNNMTNAEVVDSANNIIQKNQQNQSIQQECQSVQGIYDHRGIVSGRIADEDKGEFKASNEYNPFFNTKDLQKQGYKIIEDYEGAVVLRKMERY